MSRPFPNHGIAGPVQLLLIGLLLLVLVSGVKADNHLRVIESGPYHVRLSWTAPGDDHNIGQATRYDIRHHQAPLTEQNWDLATIVDFQQIASPRPAGSADSALIWGLTPNSLYYFAIKTADEVLNWSEISTVISVQTPALDSNGQGDIIISNERITDITTASAVVRWSTNLPTTSQIVYGINAFDYATESDQSLIVQHSVTLTNLVPDQAYIARAISTDAQGNATGGDALSFTTLRISTNLADGPPVPQTRTSYQNPYPRLIVFNINGEAQNVYFFEVATDTTFSVLIDQSPGIMQQTGPRTGWQVETELSAGQVYFWRASVNGGNYSPAQQLLIEPVTYAFPNPFYVGQTNRVTFANIPSGSTLSLISISGELIRQWPNINSGTAEWDGTNGDGHPVAGEKYLWYIDGTDIKGKIILIR